MNDHCVILGVPFRVLSRASLNARVREWLAAREGRGRVVVTPNPEFLVRASVDRTFRSVLRSADVRLPDGVGLVLAARLLWGVPLRRVTGVDFLLDLSDAAARTGRRVFLLGGAPGVAEEAGAALRRLAPDLRVVGAESGDGSDSAGGLEGVLERIRHTQADIVVVAYGAPKQERWIATHRRALAGVTLFTGVGGAFDYLAHVVPRAPDWVRRAGLEWLYRLGRQPRRLGRIFVAVAVFPVLAIADRFRQLLTGRSVR